MCHGHIDPKTLMREAEDRYRAGVAVENNATARSGAVPAELIGGLRGVWARLKARVRFAQA